MESKSKRKIVLIDISTEHYYSFGSEIYDKREYFKRLYTYLSKLEDEEYHLEVYFFNEEVRNGSKEELKDALFYGKVDLRRLYRFISDKVDKEFYNYSIEIISFSPIFFFQNYIYRSYYSDYISIFDKFKRKIKLVFLISFKKEIDFILRINRPNYQDVFRFYEGWKYLDGYTNLYYLSNARLKEFKIDLDYLIDRIIRDAKSEREFLRTMEEDSEYMTGDFNDTENGMEANEIGGIDAESDVDFTESYSEDIESRMEIYENDELDNAWNMESIERFSERLEEREIPKSIKPYLSSIFPSEVKKSEFNTGCIYLYEESFKNLVIQDKEIIKGEKNQNYNDLTRKIDGFVIEKGDSVSVEIESQTFLIISERFDFKWEVNYNKLQIDFKSPETIGKGDILISVKVRNLLVAQMVCSISIENELKNEKNLHHDTGFFEHVFISYSRKDIAIIKSYTRKYKALGIKVFIDTEEIRSGQNWRQEILYNLQKSNIFQLFWSNSARKSEYVKEEYKSALELIKTKVKDNYYIRPNYWEIPMPECPEELSHINFYRLKDIPFLIKSRNKINVAMNRVLVGLKIKKDSEKGGDLIP